MTIRQIRKSHVGVENRNRLPERLDTVDDVTMAEQRALRVARCARRVNHDRDVFGGGAFSAFAQKCRASIPRRSSAIGHSGTLPIRIATVPPFFKPKDSKALAKS